MPTQLVIFWELSNDSEQIVLVDHKGNRVDSVKYFDDKPWPIHADGGGSSLDCETQSLIIQFQNHGQAILGPVRMGAYCSYTMTAQVPLYPDNT